VGVCASIVPPTDANFFDGKDKKYFRVEQKTKILLFVAGECYFFIPRCRKVWNLFGGRCRKV
ncbi:MAG: hypothetical protein II165_03850, partial [Bacteroidales bacterium]|nr:hypothetical protein [Bacteroidales bacterium]